MALQLTKEIGLRNIIVIDDVIIDESNAGGIGCFIILVNG